MAAGLVGGMTMGIASAAQSSPVHYKVIEKTFVVASGATVARTLTCPHGMSPVGGGAHYGAGEFAETSQDTAGDGISESDLSLNHRGWTVVTWVAATYGASSFTADVICASW
jgi:hypothetical protein